MPVSCRHVHFRMDYNLIDQQCCFLNGAARAMWAHKVYTWVPLYLERTRGFWQMWPNMLLCRTHRHARVQIFAKVAHITLRSTFHITMSLARQLRIRGNRYCVCAFMQQKHHI